MAPPYFQGPGAHVQQHPHHCPPSLPCRGTPAQQPGKRPPPAQISAAQGPPLTQGQGAWHHQHHQHASAAPDAYPLMSQYYRTPTVPSPPRPSAAGPHKPPTRRGALDSNTPSRVPRIHLAPPPALATVCTGAIVPRAAGTPSRPQPQCPAPPAAPTARLPTFRPPCAPIDQRGAVHAH